MAKLLLNARIEAKTLRGLKMRSSETGEPISKIVREILEANIKPKTRRELEIGRENDDNTR